VGTVDLDRWLRPRTKGEPVAIAVGAMNFGDKTPEDEAGRIVDLALERGLVLFDTANMYAAGASEEILGRVLAKKRDRVLIATKVGIGMKPAKPEGLSRSRVLAAIDESLKRLRTEHVDLYYLHAPDPHTPLEETLDALGELVKAGKTRAIGLSNYSAWHSLEILHLAKERSLPPPEIGQMLYNLLIRELEIEYLQFAKRHRIHTTVYNPLAGGLLTGLHSPGAPPKGSRFDANTRYQRRYWTDRAFELVESHKKIASEIGLSSIELAYAWLASRSGVDSILVGPRTAAQLEAALDAVTKTIPGEALAKIDEVHRAYLGTDTHYAR
jgi:aryl-alcohol dehydrogenase-like predicted oxidoreductase